MLCVSEQLDGPEVHEAFDAGRGRGCAEALDESDERVASLVASKWFRQCQ